MISFKTFLEQTEHSVPSLAEFIHEKCKPYCDAMDYFSGEDDPPLLLRNMNGTKSATSRTMVSVADGRFNVPVWECTVRKDRRPLSTPGPLHDALQDWFDDKFGVYARSKSLFCLGKKAYKTTSLDQYGYATYAIFPIGKFDCIWSPNVDDLYSNLEFSITKQEVDMNFIKLVKTGTPESEWLPQLNKYLDSLKYVNGEVRRAGNNSAEVMLHCDNYLAVDVTDSLKYVQKSLESKLPE